MKDEPVKSTKNKNLDERFARFPEMYERMQRIADQMEQAIGQGMSADEAEEMAIVQVNELGKALMSDWAKARHDQSVREVQREVPQAIKNVKKN